MSRYPPFLTPHSHRKGASASRPKNLPYRGKSPILATLHFAPIEPLTSACRRSLTPGREHSSRPALAKNAALWHFLNASRPFEKGCKACRAIRHSSLLILTGRVQARRDRKTCRIAANPPFSLRCTSLQSSPLLKKGVKRVAPSAIPHSSFLIPHSSFLILSIRWGDASVQTIKKRAARAAPFRSSVFSSYLWKTTIRLLFFANSLILALVSSFTKLVRMRTIRVVAEELITSATTCLTALTILTQTQT